MAVTDPSLIDDAESVDDSLYYSAWTTLTVGVSDLNNTLQLWVDEFGFDLVSKKDGDDPQLCKLWGLAAKGIHSQALVRTNHSASGMLHFIQFNSPDEPVRKGAENFDLVPKNLDIYAHDLPAKVEKLKQAGIPFRSEQATELTAPDGTQFREIHLLGDDNINIVLIETVGKHHDYTSKGFAGIGPLVLTVPDVEKESDFFQSNFLVDKLNENILEGEKIEKMIGLPPGTKLKILIWGRAGHALGELEIIEYQGVKSKNLYPRAKPKALGILQLSYVSSNIGPLTERLKANDINYVEKGELNTLISNGRVISFTSPAGLKIDVYETAEN